jgi:KaiC/GvpD/RAD55 family RecA-like ATPase
MDLEKQTLVLSALIGSRDLMAMCSGILKPTYFDPSLRKSVKFVNEYFGKYKDCPKIQTVKAETGLGLDDLGKIERADVAFIADEIETFCRNRAVTEAVMAAPELIQKEEFGIIVKSMQDAISVGLQKDLGMDYFLDPEGRLRKTLETDAKISTGILELDDAIGGGISRQELLMFAANSGGGKSMTMLNVAKNFLAQGLRGVYISLEMAEGIVSKRLDSMITKIAQDQLLKEINKAAMEIAKASSTYGRFIIKRMPENRTTANSIRSYLQQLEQSTGFRPDFIVVDYLDIMGTDMNISYDNLFVKDKYVTEEVRSLGFDFDAIVLSASQLGRQAIDAEKLSQAHIQGGISKINTSDYTVGIVQTDIMRASGEIDLEILKSRNSGGVGRRIHLGWDPISLSITAKGGKLELKKSSKTSSILSTDGMKYGKNKNSGVLGLIDGIQA